MRLNERKIKIAEARLRLAEAELELAKLNEEVWISSPENFVELYITEDTNKPVGIGAIKSKTKYAAMLLSQQLQKVGYKCVQNRPDAWVKSIQRDYNIGDQLTISIAQWVTAEPAIKKAAEFLKTDYKQVKPCDALFRGEDNPKTAKDFISKRRTLYC